MEERLADFVIITALQEELQALLAKLPSPQRLPPTDEDVRIYYQVELPVTLSDKTTGVYRLVLLSLLGMGRVEAANAANNAIRRWHPSYVLLVGISGGIAEASVQRGDVIVSEQIVDYELQKLTGNGNQPRWQVHRADPRLFEAARHLEEKSWHDQIKKRRPQKGKSRCIMGPIATGDKVVAVKYLLDQLQRHWPKLIGIEMEAGGVASASFQAAEQPGFLMIRGVSDLADEHKDDSWRSYACHVAAAYTLAFLLSGPVLFSKQTGEKPQKDQQDHISFLEETHKYLHWLIDTTAKFLVPGISVRLPVEQAWIPLKTLGNTLEAARSSTLEEKIASYHEWERLSYQEHVYSAQDITEYGNRVVIIAGPGAGKSTLCQRTTHRLARAGKLVLQVKLSLVAQRCSSGHENIEEALSSVAAANSGVHPQILRKMLNELDCLLADGLDECGRYCVEMAEQLRRWASSHPHTRVIVTTRPMWYNSASFEGWHHVELLPLDSDHIAGYARSILEHLEPDPSILTGKIQRFQFQIETNKIASMAARSPLLLDFLVQLVHHNIPFAHHRAALYEQVLVLWYKTPPKDHSILTSEPGVSFAHEVLNRVGWHLQQPSLPQTERSLQGILNALAPQLCEHGQNVFAMKEKIEHCLTFWQERGVLALLQVGPEEAYTFIHATLGEYAAGRYLAACDESVVRNHLEKVRHDARWRETLLLAAGAGKANTIAEHLLSLDQENDPAAIESLLAAAILAESPHASNTLSVKVAERISNRLCSAIPMVAYESAQNSIGLAAQIPEQMEPLLRPLVHHPQLWTRLTALRLMLAAGDTAVDMDALEAFFDDCLVPEDTSKLGESPPPQTTQDIRKYILGRREPWHTFNEIIALGAEILVRLRPGEATARRLERLARLQSGVSVHANQIIFRLLKQLGYHDLVTEIMREHTSPIRNIPWDTITKEYRQADQALLEAVLRVTDTASSSPQSQRHPLALSALIYALQLPQCSFQDWLALGERRNLASLDTVLMGTIAALNLDYTEVAKDAAWALMRVTENPPAGEASEALLSILPELPVEPDWERVAERIHLPASDLVHALYHPSHAIAISAAQLISAGAGGSRISYALEEILEKDEDFALQMVACIAHSVWGKEALVKLLHRLNSSLTRGCRWLLRELPNLSEKQCDEQVRDVLVASLSADEPLIAIAAAETLQSLSEALLKAQLPDIQSAFKLWSTRGDYCEKHQCYVREKCCSTVPLCPRAEILKVLVHCSAPTLYELLDATCDTHSNVRQAATQGVVCILSVHTEYVSEVVRDVNKGRYSSSVLEAVLSLPTTALLPAQEALLALFSSESAILRRIVVRNAATATWLTKEQAVHIAQSALQDSDLAVRNLAITTLRARRFTV